MKNRRRLFLIAMILLTIAAEAGAGTIITPVSASANVATNAGFSLAATFNQSGLSVGYTAGVTDFDVYLAGNPTHNGSSSINDWAGPQNTPSAVITYDLGGLFSVESFVLWNRGLISQGIKDFNLVFSTDPSFSVSSSIPGLVGGTTGGNSTAQADVFTFAPIQASFARLEILSTYNTGGLITFGEVAFEQAAASPMIPAVAIPTFSVFGIVLTILGFLIVVNRRLRLPAKRS